MLCELLILTLFAFFASLRATTLVPISKMPIADAFCVELKQILQRTDQRAPRLPPALVLNGGGRCFLKLDSFSICISTSSRQASNLCALIYLSNFSSTPHARAIPRKDISERYLEKIPRKRYLRKSWEQWSDRLAARSTSPIVRPRRCRQGPSVSLSPVCARIRVSRTQPATGQVVIWLAGSGLLRSDQSNFD